MSYSYKYRVGFHEVDKDKNLTLESMINYFQDVGGFHGDDCGCSYQQLAQRDLAWIIVSWQVAVDEKAKLGQEVIVETLPYRFKFCMADRYFILRDENGKILARANSQWVMMHVSDMSFAKIPADIIESYKMDENIFKEYDFGGRKIAAANELQTMPPVETAPYMIDANHHVNNQQYVSIAGSFLPENADYNLFRATYTKQAHLGDVLMPTLGKLKNGYQVILSGTDNEPYFTAEWIKREI